jgi:hypothetical protein
MKKKVPDNRKKIRKRLAARMAYNLLGRWLETDTI